MNSGSWHQSWAQETLFSCLDKHSEFCCYSPVQVQHFLAVFQFSPGYPTWLSRTYRFVCAHSGSDTTALIIILLPCFCFLALQNSLIPGGLTWEEMLYPLYQKYKSYITWGDQDLLNIIFYFNPGKEWFLESSLSALGKYNELDFFNCYLLLIICINTLLWSYSVTASSKGLQPMKIFLTLLQVMGLGLGSIEYINLFSGDLRK